MRTPLDLTTTFDCARTCPANRVHWCRFNAVFRALGTARIHSHTVKIKTELRDPEPLRRAVESMGGEFIGRGTHKLFDRSEHAGLAFTLPNWRYQLIATDAGELAYDDYGGQWGNVADLAALRTAYTTAAVETAAAQLGWLTERTPAGITVHHPDGGTLTVSTDGTCETAGFIGQSCHSARESLGLMTDGAITNKPENEQIAAQVQQTR